MVLDYDIIKELIPIEDKSSFLVISHQIRGAYIFATYKMLDGPFDDVRNLQEKFSWDCVTDSWKFSIKLERKFSPMLADLALGCGIA